jgi:flagellar biosynthetic protein FlhB
MGDSNIIVFDLQLFGKAEDEGRTEQPTQRRLAQARRRGQVAKSPEVAQALVLLISFWFLSVYSPYIYTELNKLIKGMIGELHSFEFSEGNIHLLAISLSLIFAKLVLPIMAIALVVALIVNIKQVGFSLHWSIIKPNFSRIKPSFRRVVDQLLISTNTLYMFAKSVVKAAVIFYIAYQVIRREYLPLLLLGEVMPGFAFIGRLGFEIVMKVAFFLLIMSLIDYKYQKYRYIESLKMTKQEVKDEWKMREGDPLIKAKIKEKQREAVLRRMVQDIPGADVVITNPAHLAVAIKYEPGQMNAPIVVAKGAGPLAERIIKIAEENGVPVVENKALAEALYRSTDIGEEIPPELYRAVAEVLSFVYRMKNKAVGGVG